MRALGRDTEVLARETEVREAVRKMIEAEADGQPVQDCQVKVTLPDGETVTINIRRVGAA